MTWIFMALRVECAGIGWIAHMQMWKKVVFLLVKMDQICTEVSLVSFFSDAVQEMKLVVG